MWGDNVKALREAWRNFSYHTVSRMEVIRYRWKGEASRARQAWVRILPFPFKACNLVKYS